jgi:hypothetical protein
MNKDDIARHKAATGPLDYIRIDPICIPKAALESRELTQSIYDELMSRPEMQKSGLDFDDSRFSSSAKKWSSVTDNGPYSVGYRYEQNNGTTKTLSATTASPITSTSPVLTGNIITTQNGISVSGISASGISATSGFVTSGITGMHTFAAGSVSSTHHMFDERISELLATIKDLEDQITLLTNKTHETFSTDEKFDTISAWDRAMSSISK